MPDNVRAHRARAAGQSRPNAHIRHALDVAEEQVEEMQEIRVGDAIHYLFEAEVFASRDEAEEMRARRIGVVARRFYEELPAALAGARGTRADVGPRTRQPALEKNHTLSVIPGRTLRQ